MWCFCAEHAGLGVTVGTSAEKNAGLFLHVRAKIPTSPRVREKWGTQSIFQRSNCILESGAIAGSVTGTGWAEGSRLAVGEVAAEHGIAGAGECVGQRDKQRSLGVASGTVGQDQSVAVGSCGEVQKSADRGIDREVSKIADGGVRQGNILNA